MTLNNVGLSFFNRVIPSTKNKDPNTWLETQNLKSKRQILDRLSKIEDYGHLGILEI